jgi:hypothetical protein
MATEPHATWEYRVTDPLPEGELNALGADGWELVAVTADRLYLKRPRPDFREQVTLDQKRRYYALWGQDGDPSSEAEP